MIPWWWSWLLTAIGVSGLLIAGNKRSWGWLVNLAAQVLWISYAVATEQWGFLLSAFAYGFVYARNYLKWQRDRRWVAFHCGHCGADFEGWMDEARCPLCGSRYAWVRGIPVGGKAKAT